MEEEKKNKGNLVLTILLIIALIAIVVMGYFLYTIYTEKKEIEEACIYASEQIRRINEEVANLQESRDDESNTIDDSQSIEPDSNYKEITNKLEDDAFYVTKAIKNGDNYTLQGVIYKKYTIAESELQRGYVDIYGERYFVEKNDDGNYYFTNSEVFHIGKLENGKYSLIGNDQIGTRWELTEKYGEITVSSNTKCVFPYGVGDDTNVKTVEEVFKDFKEVKPHDNIGAGDSNLFYLNKFENGKCTELYCAHTSI